MPRIAREKLEGNGKKTLETFKEDCILDLSKKKKKIRKGTISFVMSFRTHGTALLRLDGFSRKFVFQYFFYIFLEISIFIKI